MCIINNIDEGNHSRKYQFTSSFLSLLNENLYINTGVDCVVRCGRVNEKCKVSRGVSS